MILTLSRNQFKNILGLLSTQSEFDNVLKKLKISRHQRNKIAKIKIHITGFEIIEKKS